MYTDEWIKEGISIETMEKYNILLFYMATENYNPHFDVNNQLIGVRGRSLIDEDIELFGKYTPFKVGRRFYNHSLGMNLFGLNHNLKAIQKKKEKSC